MMCIAGDRRTEPRRAARPGRQVGQADERIRAHRLHVRRVEGLGEGQDPGEAAQGGAGG